MNKSFDRRGFLRATGAGVGIAASSVLPGCRVFLDQRKHVPLDRNRRAVKLSMVQGEFAGKSLLEKFQLLRRLGFDGVELDSPNELSLDEVLAAKAATGLEIPGVVDSRHWQQRLNDADVAVRGQGVEALRTALRDAKAYGASTVLLVPGKVSKLDDYAACYRLSQEGIREVLPLAEELEVQIALENAWNNFLLSPVECARYIDELDSPWVGAYLDVGNVLRHGWPEHWIRALGHRILKIDVKEYQRQRRTFAVPLLEGDCDWPGVMKALHEVRYRGWFTAELPGGGEQSLRDTATRMQRILDLAQDRAAGT